MKTKKWGIEHNGYSITAINSWDWNGETIEEFYINDKLIDKRITKIFEDGLLEVISCSFEAEHKGDTIKVEFGQAWHLI